jgi:hypothetical protein
MCLCEKHPFYRCLCDILESITIVAVSGQYYILVKCDEVSYVLCYDISGSMNVEVYFGNFECENCGFTFVIFIKCDQTTYVFKYLFTCVTSVLRCVIFYSPLSTLLSPRMFVFRGQVSKRTKRRMESRSQGLARRRFSRSLQKSNVAQD